MSHKILIVNLGISSLHINIFSENSCGRSSWERVGKNEDNPNMFDIQEDEAILRVNCFINSYNSCFERRSRGSLKNRQ